MIIKSFNSSTLFRKYNSLQNDKNSILFIYKIYSSFVSIIMGIGRRVFWGCSNPSPPKFVILFSFLGISAITYYTQ